MRCRSPVHDVLCIRDLPWHDLRSRRVHLRDRPVCPSTTCTLGYRRAETLRAQPRNSSEGHASPKVPFLLSMMASMNAGGGIGGGGRRRGALGLPCPRDPILPPKGSDPAPTPQTRC